MKSEISAFMDGELAGAELETVLEALREDGEALSAWRTYHLIGDALHGPAAPGGRCIARVLARLDQEPVLIGTLPADIAPAQRPRWFVPSAVAASLSAIALVGWMAFAPRPTDTEVARVVEPVVIAASKPAAKPVLERHPLSASTRDYLLAHQVYSPRNSLQGVAPYIRSVSAEAAGTP